MGPESTKIQRNYWGIVYAEIFAVSSCSSIICPGIIGSA